MLSSQAWPGFEEYTGSPGIEEYTGSPGIEEYTGSPGIMSTQTWSGIGSTCMVPVEFGLAFHAFAYALMVL